MCDSQQAADAGKKMPDTPCNAAVGTCPGKKKVSRSRVEFRPTDAWTGEYGFDWMRIGGTAEKAGEDVYKSVVVSGDGGLDAARAYTAMKSEYSTIPIEITSAPETLKEYLVPYLSLFPKGTAGTPTPPFEAELKILTAVEENPPDLLELEYDKALFTLSKDRLADKAVGAKRAASDGTVKITCNSSFNADQDIKVWATFEGVRTQVGELKVCKNDDASRKSVKFLFVNVKTNINGTMRIGSVSDAEKTALRNVLFQALITCEMEDAASAFDMSADDNLRIKTAGGTKTYGKFIYQKKPGDGPDKTEGLFEDYPGNGFFSYVRAEFLKAPGNAKYDKHFTIFAFDEVPYDVTTYGQVESIGVHNAALFFPAGGRKVTTMAHEVLHGLLLHHTHDSPSATNKYIFKSGTTDNIMSYSAARYSTWRRQWEVMKGGL
jgi:hypothetical protein